MIEEFYERVYDLIKLIPFGRVTTYGEIARATGKANAGRLVSFAIFHIEKFSRIPTHRIVSKTGRLSRKFLNGGIRGQKSRLEDEGIEVKNYKVDLQKYGFYFW